MIFFFKCREIVVIYKKIIMISFTLFSDASVLTKAYLLLFLNYFMMSLTRKYLPFLEDKFNLLELYSNYSVLLITFSANLYILYDNEFLSILQFGVIITANAFLLVQLTKSLVNILKKTKYIKNFLTKVQGFINTSKLKVKSN